jgi:hypothetical protein
MWPLLSRYSTSGIELGPALGERLGAALGEELGAVVGPKPAVHVSCCVIIAAFPRSARVSVSKLPTREESAIIATFPAAKMMPCIDAFAPM